MSLETKILIIEDDQVIINLINKIFRNENADFEVVPTVQEGLRKIQNNKFHIIIADYDICEGTVIRYLKRNSVDIPIVVITSQDLDKRIYLEEGAMAVVSKPFYGKELYFTVMNLLKILEMYAGLEESSSIIRALSSALDYRDSYTEGHSIRVLEFTLMLYQGMGLADEIEKHDIELGCMLHDIGKIGIPDNILKSPNKLTPEERVAIQEHSAVGYNICKDIKNLQGALDIIRWHHEKMDGSGYPDGLVGDQIPDIVQMVSIADIFDALTTKRTYRNEISVEEALQVLIKEAKEGKLNDYFVASFARMARDKIRKRGIL